jgi:hypothetical protein
MAMTAPGAPVPATRTEDDGLHLYLAFEPFLTAHTLARVIEAVDGLYEVMSQASTLRDLAMTRDGASRLRVREVHTGNSIDLIFDPGLAQTILDPQTAVPVVVGGAGALAFAAHTLIGVYRHVNKARAERRALDPKAREDVAKARIAEAAADKIEAEARTAGVVADFETKAIGVALADLVGRAEVRHVIREAIQGKLPPGMLERTFEDALGPIALFASAVADPLIREARINREPIVGPPPLSAGEGEEPTA